MVCLFAGGGGGGGVRPVLWFGQSLSEGSIRLVLEHIHGGARETAHVMFFFPGKGKVPFVKKEALQGGRQGSV